VLAKTGDFVITRSDSDVVIPAAMATKALDCFVPVFAMTGRRKKLVSVIFQLLAGANL
jgi:hypothetical protein